LATTPALADQITEVLNAGLPLTYLESYRSNVNGVTPETASEAGQALTSGDDLVLIMVGDPETVVSSAQSHASHVYVYDLDGNLVDELEGALPSNCQ
ncbi:MAG: hypothetical protein KC561_19590, partial [Myxococcales bacterium]|nr:hypothetical protein [Myxococcales bacterium]